MPHLAVSDVRAKYGSLEVLKGISFGVGRGEVVAIVGPSGSGKSTVLRVLMGLTPVTSGNVRIDDTQVDYGSRSSVRSARERMAIVFQQYNLFQNMTVIRNITLAPTKIQRRTRREVEREGRELLSLIGLAEKADAYPDELSGGQQQRVAIARALALRPEILLLDEVTSALDPELVNEVLDSIRRLTSEGMTMLIVSHEMAFVKEVANSVIFMDDGKIVEHGSPAEIFDSPQSQRAKEFFGKVLRA